MEGLKGMKIKLALTNDAAQIFEKIGIDPRRYTPAYDGESVGLDLYNVGHEVVLQSHHVWSALGERPTLIPTGIHVMLPPGTVGLIKERSSIVKSGLLCRAGVIDPGYSGEIFINLVNLGGKKVTIETGAKLPVQLVVVPCINQYETIHGEEFIKLTASNRRAQGSLGSSNREQG